MMAQAQRNDDLVIDIVDVFPCNSGPIVVIKAARTYFVKIIFTLHKLSFVQIISMI